MQNSVTDIQPEFPILTYHSEQAITDLVAGFRNGTLPKERWTHEAHLTVAIWFHKNYSAHEAICYLRSGIISYNVASGGKNTHEDGYHETMTLFWCRIIHDFVSINGQWSLLELCNRFIGSPAASKELPLIYYTRSILFCTEARATWVEPDLRKL